MQDGVGGASMMELVKLPGDKGNITIIFSSKVEVKVGYTIGIVGDGGRLILTVLAVVR